MLFFPSYKTTKGLDHPPKILQVSVKTRERDARAVHVTIRPMVNNWQLTQALREGVKSEKSTRTRSRVAREQ